MSQLDVALTFYLEDRELVSSITLAGAAEEILGKLCEQSGKASSLSRHAESARDLHLHLMGLFPQVFRSDPGTKAFVNLRNQTKNELKHLISGSPIEADFQDKAGRLIADALKNYRTLGGRESNMQYITSGPRLPTGSAAVRPSRQWREVSRSQNGFSDASNKSISKSVPVADPASMLSASVGRDSSQRIAADSSNANSVNFRNKAECTAAPGPPASIAASIRDYLQAGNSLKVLNIAGNKLQMMMYGCCSNPQGVVPNHLSCRAQLPRRLCHAPGNVSINPQNRVAMKANPAILFPAGFESFGEFARADHTDMKGCVWILCQKQLSRARPIAFDFSLQVNQKCRVKQHQRSSQCDGLRDGSDWVRES